MCVCVWSYSMKCTYAMSLFVCLSSVQPDRCIPDGGETVRESLYLLYPQCSRMCAKTGWREMVSRNNRGACICDLPSVQPDLCIQDGGTWLGRTCIWDITYGWIWFWVVLLAQASCVVECLSFLVKFSWLVSLECFNCILQVALCVCLATSGHQCLCTWKWSLC